MLTSIHNKTKKSGHKIIVDIDKKIKINSNPGAFFQIITNFVMNSIIHAFNEDEVGEIKISAYTDEGKLYFDYRDNGKGLTDESKEKIFCPFYTTNRGGGGSGLGMNIVYNLITTKLGGSVDIVSSLGHGVEFKIVIDGCVESAEVQEALMV